jgi:hypothetical protein
MLKQSFEGHPFLSDFRLLAGLIFQGVEVTAFPICSMVLEYVPTFARTKSPSFVGKYIMHGVYETVNSWIIHGYFMVSISVTFR